jgi:hypothetical protein
MLRAPMSQALELWSLPWHALQHRLAQRLRADSLAAGSPRSQVERKSAPPAGSWLLRALDLSPPAR